MSQSCHDKFQTRWLDERRDLFNVQKYRMHANGYLSWAHKIDCQIVLNVQIIEIHRDVVQICIAFKMASTLFSRNGTTPISNTSGVKICAKLYTNVAVGIEVEQ